MPQTTTLNKAKNLAKNPVGESVKTITSFGDHWPILAVAGFLDFTVGLIPFAGFIINPLFTAVLFLYWSGKTKKKNLVISMLFGTGGGMIIEAIPVANFLPTNLANAMISIVSK